MTVPELRKVCKRGGLPHAGKKIEILERLVKSYALVSTTSNINTANTSATASINELSVIANPSSFVKKSFKKKVNLNDTESDEDSESDDELRVEPVFKTLRRVFKFKRFRNGQEWAIRRVLDGKNTLLVLPTGGGKSLTYQLPAAMLPGLTLVVSPLLSLMEDQILHLPLGLPGAALTSYTTKVETAAILRDLQSRNLKILFV